ncbi:MAG: PTS glucose transporter subunit IIA [Propionibacteriaceae bacterium]|nr:PTS glucose transporter subunit IIA [Propionibacteriaceae bacterium]
MEILAPCAGRVIAMPDVQDPVFSEQLAGPGVGIEPVGGASHVLAPANGVLLSVKPHAFIVLVGGSVGILVHIGINTVELGGEGFELLAAQGQAVSAGDPVVGWNPDMISGDNVLTTVVVAVMDHAPDSIVTDKIEQDVAPGDVLFQLG